jgi:hypothetical protein
MTDENETKDDLTPEELEQHEGEPLPERHAMSIVDPSTGTLPPLPVVDDAV